MHLELVILTRNQPIPRNFFPATHFALPFRCVLRSAEDLYLQHASHAWQTMKRGAHIDRPVLILYRLVPSRTTDQADGVHRIETFMAIEWMTDAVDFRVERAGVAKNA